MIEENTLHPICGEKDIFESILEIASKYEITDVVAIRAVELTCGCSYFMPVSRSEMLIYWLPFFSPRKDCPECGVVFALRDISFAMGYCWGRQVESTFYKTDNCPENFEEEYREWREKARNEWEPSKNRNLH